MLTGWSSYVGGQGSLTTGLGITGNCKVSRILWCRPKETRSLIGSYLTVVAVVGSSL